MTDPFVTDGPTVVSFSGGRTSGYMLRRILQAHGGALPADTHVVFANTGKERPETLAFVDECTRRWDVPIRWVERDGSKPSGQRFREVTYATAARNGEPFAELIRERNFPPSVVMRFCTQELKIRVMRDFMRAQGHDYWTNVVGLRRDEGHRVSSAKEHSDRERWDIDCPLYDAGIAVGDVSNFWQDCRGGARARTLALAARSTAPWVGSCAPAARRQLRPLLSERSPEARADHARAPRPRGLVDRARARDQRPLSRARTGLREDARSRAAHAASADGSQRRGGHDPVYLHRLNDRRGEGHALSCRTMWGGEVSP